MLDRPVGPLAPPHPTTHTLPEISACGCIVKVEQDLNLTESRELNQLNQLKLLNQLNTLNPLDLLNNH